MSIGARSRGPSSFAAVVRVLAVGALTLPLVGASAASSAASTPMGTASTSVSALSLEIDGGSVLPGVDVSLELLEGGTYASTDPAGPRGGPFAAAQMTPLAIGDETFGAVEARSDGDAAARGALVDESGVTVAPVSATAEANAARARASLDASVAEVVALAGSLGIGVDLATNTSHVDDSAASARQGLLVSGIDLELGDLVPLDVLEQLPLDTILDLLASLDVGVPAVDAAIAAVEDAVVALDDAVAAVESAGAAVSSPLADVADLGALVADLEDILTTLGAVDVVGDPVGALATLTGVVDSLATLGIDCGVSPDLLSLATDLADLVGCVTAERDASQALLVDAVVAVEAAVDVLVGAVAGVEAAVDDLLTALVDLEALLGEITGLLDDLAGSELLAVGVIDVSVTAVATDTVEGSSATLVCEPVAVTVLTQEIVSPSCEEVAGAVEDLQDTLDAALAELEAILGALPVDLPDAPASVRLFPNAGTTVMRDGDHVTAQAILEILEIDVRSLTLDPALVTGTLLDVDVSDVVATVQTVVGDVLDELQATQLLRGVGTLLDAAVGTVTAIDTSAIEALVQDVIDLLAGLDLDGTLSEALTTPSVSLSIDPTSTARFAAPATTGGGGDGGDDGGDDDGDGTDGSPTTPGTDGGDDPTLPSTGGGATLLGLVALAGALTLLRRR